LPDIDRPIGGVKQLYRHVEHLNALGWDAKLLTQNSGFRPSWFVSSAPTTSLQESVQSGDLDPGETVLVLPETYCAADLRSVANTDLSGFSRVIFNQNAYNTYGQFTSDTARRLAEFYNPHYLLQVFSISEDTHDFLRRALGLSDQLVSRIINAIEPIFRDDLEKEKLIIWLPRKNRDHGLAILHGLARSHSQFLKEWRVEAMNGLTHAQVAEKFNRARLFLSFGHPEGFGLPIAEAMAAGCWVVGYHGGGGRELFCHGASEAIAFGDWNHFQSAIVDTLRRYQEQPRETELRLKRQAVAIRSLYSSDAEQESIRMAWQRVAEVWLQRKTD
jgi:hypothetical protein